MDFTHIKPLAISLLLLVSLSACERNGNPPTPASTPTSTTIKGQAIAGAVDGTIIIRDAAGTQLATATVTTGAFTVEIPNTSLTQALDFEVTGSYRDGVSGAQVTLDASNPLALHLAANHFSANQHDANAPITADTTLVYHLIQAGQSITQAETTFAAVFGYKPDLTAQPFDPYTTTLTSETQADQDATFRAAIFSQLGNNMGLNATDLAEMPAKLAADLLDGSFDGLSNGNPVSFTGSGANLQQMHQHKPMANRLNIAMAQFARSTANQAGLSMPSMGLPPTPSDASGSIKTITLADGTQVHVQLDVRHTTPFQAGFRSVKTTHQITLTHAATNAPIDTTAAGSIIDSLMLMPMMHMNSGHAHSTPHQHMLNITQAANGIYTTDAYYLMSSAMNNMPMGQWELNIQLGDTTSTNMMDPYAHGYFFPNVMINMGNDILTSKVNNTADQWTNTMGMTIPREYSVWLQDVSANPAGGHNLTVFVSTRDMADMNMGGGMGGIAHGGMKFPAVYVGQTLHDPLNGMNMRPAKTLASVVVEVSTDAGNTWNVMTPVQMMMMATGKYKRTALTGLTTGQAANIDIRLTIDGNIMLDTAGNNPKLNFSAP